jgi:hypothetical protein
MTTKTFSFYPSLCTAATSTEISQKYREEGSIPITTLACKRLWHLRTPYVALATTTSESFTPRTPENTIKNRSVKLATVIAIFTLLMGTSKSKNTGVRMRPTTTAIKRTLEVL